MNPSTNCPHCEAEYKQTKDQYFFECGTERIYGWDNTKCYAQSELCREREARQKAEKDLELHKRFLAETVEACEPLRNTKGLQLGQRITVEGVKLMIAENQKLRVLVGDSLRSMQAVLDAYNCDTTVSPFDVQDLREAWVRIHKQLNQLTCASKL